MHQSTDATILAHKSFFNLIGWPRIIRSDDRPAFRGAFTAWAKSENIKHELSATYLPQSNGVAEGAVRKAKDIIKRCTSAKEDIEAAMAEMNNFCSANPAKIFFKRSVRG